MVFSFDLVDNFLQGLPKICGRDEAALLQHAVYFLFAGGCIVFFGLKKLKATGFFGQRYMNTIYRRKVCN